MIYQSICDLIGYAEAHLGLPEADETYVSNLLMQKFGLNEMKPCWVNAKKIAALTCPDEVLSPLKEYA